MKTLKPILLQLFLGLVLILSACGTGPMAPAPDSSGRITKGGVHLWEYDKSHFNLYSVNDDIHLGERVLQEQLREFKRNNVAVDPPKHSALLQRIRRVVNRLAVVSDRPNLPYEVHLVDMPDVVNAYVLPGGKVVVFSGLFDPKKGLVDPNNESQIAAVLGHELAHANLRHVTRQITSVQGLGLLGNIASIAIGSGIGVDASRFFQQIYSLGVNLYFPTYTRKHEREADQVGLYYMSRARFKPEEAVRVWTGATKKGGSKTTNIFMTHPSPGERERNLTYWLPEARQVAAGKNPATITSTTTSSQTRR